VDLELHEKGDGINFVNVWNESLETRESVGSTGLGGRSRVNYHALWGRRIGIEEPAGVGGLHSLHAHIRGGNDKDILRGIHTRPGW
jgi:hypothetical protein